MTAIPRQLGCAVVHLIMVSGRNHTTTKRAAAQKIASRHPNVYSHIYSRICSRGRFDSDYP